VHIDAFLAKIKEREVRTIGLQLPPMVRACSCNTSARFCNRLLPGSTWSAMNLGCDLARHYSVFFDLEDAVQNPIFQVYGDKLVQLRPLRLKHFMTAFELLRVSTICDKLSGAVKDSLSSQLPSWCQTH
jgi:hypothetical protein